MSIGPDFSGIKLVLVRIEEIKARVSRQNKPTKEEKMESIDQGASNSSSGENSGNLSSPTNYNADISQALKAYAGGVGLGEGMNGQSFQDILVKALSSGPKDLANNKVGKLDNGEKIGTIEEKQLLRTSLPPIGPSGSRFEDYPVSEIAERYNIDPLLVRAVVDAESAWNPNAVSSKGAMGLMQLMPGTAKAMGVEDAFDPVQNLEGGIKYLSMMSDKYNGELDRMLAAYNAGPGNVDKYGGIPPFAETQNYVAKVLDRYRRYRKE